MSRKSLKIVHEPFRRSNRIRDRAASAAKIDTINLVSDEDEDVGRVVPVPMPKVVSDISCNVRVKRRGIKREKVEDRPSVLEPEESREELQANENLMECEEERGSDERGESNSDAALNLSQVTDKDGSRNVLSKVLKTEPNSNSNDGNESGSSTTSSLPEERSLTRKMDNYTSFGLDQHHHSGRNEGPTLILRQGINEAARLPFCLPTIFEMQHVPIVENPEPFGHYPIDWSEDAKKHMRKSPSRTWTGGEEPNRGPGGSSSLIREAHEVPAKKCRRNNDDDAGYHETQMVGAIQHGYRQTQKTPPSCSDNRPCCSYVVDNRRKYKESDSLESESEDESCTSTDDPDEERHLPQRRPLRMHSPDDDSTGNVVSSDHKKKSKRTPQKVPKTNKNASRKSIKSRAQHTCKSCGDVGHRNHKTVNDDLRVSIAEILEDEEL